VERRTPPRGDGRVRRGLEPALCAIGLVAQTLAILGFLLWEAIFGDYPQLLLLGIFLCLPVSMCGAAAVLTQPRPGTGGHTAARLILIVQVAAEAYLVGLLLFKVGQNLVQASTFGIDGRLDAVRLGLAALGILLIVGCVRAPALRSGRGLAEASGLPRIAAVVGIAAATSLLVVAVAGATIPRHTLRCSPFKFDEARWDSAGFSLDRARIANALVRCGTLKGKTRAEVADLLGIKPNYNSLDLWSTGTDLWDRAYQLDINYDRDDRVVGAKVTNANAFD
jgi:hypothetical protein